MSGFNGQIALSTTTQGNYAGSVSVSASDVTIMSVANNFSIAIDHTNLQLKITNLSSSNALTYDFDGEFIDNVNGAAYKFAQASISIASGGTNTGFLAGSSSTGAVNTSYNVTGTGDTQLVSMIKITQNSITYIFTTAKLEYDGTNYNYSVVRVA